MLKAFFDITSANYMYKPNNNTKVTIITSNTDIKVLYATNKLAPVGDFPADCSFDMLITNSTSRYYKTITIEHGNVYIDDNAKNNIEYLDWKTIINETM
jgi:hypothetical protein